MANAVQPRNLSVPPAYPFLRRLISAFVTNFTDREKHFKISSLFLFLAKAQTLDESSMLSIRL